MAAAKGAAATRKIVWMGRGRGGGMQDRICDAHNGRDPCVQRADGCEQLRQYRKGRVSPGGNQCT